MFETYNLKETISQLEPQVSERHDFILNQKDDRKQIVQKLIGIAKKNKIKRFDSSVKRSLGNAARHGQCPVTVNVLATKERKMLVVIKDQGQGFDYNAVVSKFKSGKKYYKRGGCGISSLSKNKHGKVCWHDGGRTISILFDK